MKKKEARETKKKASKKIETKETDRLTNIIKPIITNKTIYFC